jgi:hypothetical protein
VLLYSMDIGNRVAKMSMAEQLNVSTVVVSSRLRYQRIEKNINAFMLTRAGELAKSEGRLKCDVDHMISSTLQQGFVDDRNLRKIQQGQSYKKLDLMQLDAATREMVRTEGWTAWEKINYDRSRDVFAAVADPDCLVRVDVSSHMLFDRYSEPLPVAVNFDYISHGGITDGRYDLKRLAAHLLTRDDIQVFPRKDGWRRHECDRNARATKVEECITDIPGYNSERGCSQTIYFRWAPSSEDYRRMWAHCIESKAQYPSTCMHQAIFELDLIGARAAGCALFDDYYKSTRYEHTKDDYEEDQEDY